MDFDELKRRSSFSHSSEKNTRYITRIMDAVAGSHNGLIMETCADGGSKCGSIYCDECRHRKQRSMLYRFKQHYKEELNSDETLARKRLRWVSVLHNVVEINIKTESDEIETINNVCRSVEEMKSQISLMAKKYNDKGLWLRGGIHIEIVDYKAFRTAAELGISTIKEKTLTSFIQRMTNSQADYFFLVHFHALVDMGQMNDGAFAIMFAERWNAALRQVDITSLWDEVNAIQYDYNGNAKKDENGKYVRKKEKQKIEHAFIAMANYCFSYSNDKLQYARNWSHGKSITEVDQELRNGNIETIATHTGIRLDSTRLNKGHIRLLVSASNAVNGSSHKGIEVRID
jgi:hypothetical protein